MLSREALGPSRTPCPTCLQLSLRALPAQAGRQSASSVMFFLRVLCNSAAILKLSYNVYGLEGLDYRPLVHSGSAFVLLLRCVHCAVAPILAARVLLRG